MPSEMRRAAKALVESRVERFEVADVGDDARRRVDSALAELGAPRALRYAGTWSTVDGRPIYEATFAPSARTPTVLNLISLAIVLLIAASAWAIVTSAGRLKYLLPMLTMISVFAMPLVIVALASRREAEESRITRAIRAALAHAR